MGLFDRLFGKKVPKPEQHTEARRPAPPDDTPVSKAAEAPAPSTLSEAAPTATEPVFVPAEPNPEKTEPVPSPTYESEEAISEAAAEPAETAAEPEPIETPPPAPADAPTVVAPPVAVSVSEETIPPAEPAIPTESLTAGEAPSVLTGNWDARIQKRLETYFGRLREIYPDGEIRRLNTGHKKLAERGAELRRLIGMEGQLDEFFALGGFIYCRGTGGRPPLPDTQTDNMEDRLRERFPEAVPTVIAVRDADHRLYLDLRSAARKAGMTVGDYLRQFQAADEDTL